MLQELVETVLGFIADLFVQGVFEWQTLRRVATAICIIASLTMLAGILVTQLDAAVHRACSIGSPLLGGVAILLIVYDFYLT